MRLMSEIKVGLITGAGGGIGPDSDLGSPPAEVPTRSRVPSPGALIIAELARR
jgi:hypothetical protein